MTFAEQIEDPDCGWALDRGPVGAPLLLAFGGISGGLAMPPFEFFGLAGDLPVSKLFLRDLDQAWYQRGVRGLGSSVDVVADWIRGLVRDLRPSRTAAFGNSAGGFGALLFGTLAELDVVHAFAPQTFIDRQQRRRHLDLRWRSEIAALHRDPPSALVDDLVPVLRAGGIGTAHVHYAGDDRLDRVHARRLAGLPAVVLHEGDTGGHGLVRAMRDRGELRPLVIDALTAS